MLKDEVVNVLNVLNKHGLSEDEQRNLLINGLDFDFTYGDYDFDGINRHLNFLQVGELIEYLDNAGIEYNVNELIHQPHNFKYPKIVRAIADLDTNFVIVKKKVNKRRE